MSAPKLQDTLPMAAEPDGTPETGLGERAAGTVVADNPDGEVTAPSVAGATTAANATLAYEAAAPTVAQEPAAGAGSGGAGAGSGGTWPGDGSGDSDRAGGSSGGAGAGDGRSGAGGSGGGPGSGRGGSGDGPGSGRGGSGDGPGTHDSGAGASPPPGAAGGSKTAPGPGVISIAPGTRATLRVLLVIFACLVLLVPVGIAGVVGVFAAVDSRGSLSQRLPVDMKKLTVRGGNFNLHVSVDPDRKKPSIDVDYLGFNPAKPNIKVSDERSKGQSSGTSVTLKREGPRRVFGNVLADATIHLPEKLASKLAMDLRSTYGDVEFLGATGDDDEGNWSGDLDDAGWVSTDDEGRDTVNGSTFKTTPMGPISAASDSGTVTVAAVSSPTLLMTSKMGRAEASGTFGNLNVKTEDGNVRFNAAVRHKVRAVSTDGNIVGELGAWRPYAQPSAGVDLQSYAGNVNLHLPRNGGPGEAGKKFKGYKLRVPEGYGNNRVRVGSDSGKGAIPVRAESSTGDVTVGYSDPPQSKR